MINARPNFGSGGGGWSDEMTFSKQYNLKQGEIISVYYEVHSTGRAKSVSISQLPDFLEIIEPSGGIFDNLNRVLNDEVFEFKLKVKEDANEEKIESFDIDSSIYFMQQFNTEKVKVVGQTPQELDNLLVAEPELGAGVSEENIQRISTSDYLNYWESYKDVVYVEDNYELGLMASTYASLLNAPLIIEGTNLDKEINFQGKNVICVGNVNRNCNEKYNLKELQKKYVEKTRTDKIILVNPNDLEITVDEEFQPEKSLNPIYEIYSKTSLASPILAGAKHEVIISTTASDYEEVDSFIEDKINELFSSKYDVEYLTIIASPDAIDMYSEVSQSFAGEYRQVVDSWIYGNIDYDLFVELFVGRLFGISVSDISSYIVRSIFYEELYDLSNKKTIAGTYEMAFEETESFFSNAVEMGNSGKLFLADELPFELKPVSNDFEDISY